MWKNSMKNVESDDNKILYETLIDFFLQRKGTYCLNKPRILHEFIVSPIRATSANLFKNTAANNHNKAKHHFHSHVFPRPYI